MRSRLVLVLPIMLCLSACAALRGVAGGGVQSPPPSETPAPHASRAATGVIPRTDAKPSGFHQGLAVAVDGTPAGPRRFWSAAITSPSVVRTGRRLNYDVTLTNVFDRGLEFPNGCPEYMQALAGPGSWTTGKDWFVLNCAGMGVIQPGATVRLAMAIDVPATAPLGKSSLLWELDNGQTSWGASFADVTITN
ncbi:MAG: hypothetical protein M3Z11_03870 [Candidatus Dormibacteraeota bacterium]|nr:hypothetical protein [Candidatus Dormibacteraeota bacterium]